MNKSDRWSHIHRLWPQKESKQKKTDKTEQTKTKNKKNQRINKLRKHYCCLILLHAARQHIIQNTNVHWFYTNAAYRHLSVQRRIWLLTCINKPKSWVAKHNAAANSAQQQWHIIMYIHDLFSMDWKTNKSVMPPPLPPSPPSHPPAPLQIVSQEQYTFFTSKQKQKQKTSPCQLHEIHKECC